MKKIKEVNYENIWCNHKDVTGNNFCGVLCDSFNVFTYYFYP